MTATIEQPTLGLTTDVSIPAEAAPLGVLLWPVQSPEHAPNFTLEAVETRRSEAGTTVTWIYGSGKTRVFRLGEMVFCRIAV